MDLLAKRHSCGPSEGRTTTDASPCGGGPQAPSRRSFLALATDRGYLSAGGRWSEENMRRSNLMVLGALLGASAVFLSVPGRHALEARAADTPAAQSATDTYKQLALFGLIFDQVRAHYVEDPDVKKMVEGAVSGMLNGLDPHSSYMNSKSFGEMQVETNGEFGGLGMEVTMEDGLVKVVSPIDETPAAKAGIQANDVISELDGNPVKGLSLQQAVEKMRGPVNTQVHLKVIRKGQDKPLDFTLTRETIKVRSVRWRKEGDDVGYIRITQFNAQVGDELKKGLRLLAGDDPDKIKGYILDLRNNPGGLLDQAVAVSNAFLDRGEIVSLRVRDRRRRAAGPEAGHHPRHALVRQGLGADHHSARRQQWRTAAHHRALLHAVGPFDPGQGRLARHRGAAGRA
jgi:carboxyl-terminal processing protease